MTTTLFFMAQLPVGEEKRTLSCAGNPCNGAAIRREWAHDSGPRVDHIGTEVPRPWQSAPVSSPSNIRFGTGASPSNKQVKIGAIGSSVEGRGECGSYLIRPGSTYRL